MGKNNNRPKGMRDTSKYIALILRHKPETIGISLDEHGWANVNELIEGVNRTHPLDMIGLEQIVAEDNKQTSVKKETENMTVMEFQEMYPTKEEKIEAAKDLSDAEIDDIVVLCDSIYGKLFYTRLKKINQIARDGQKEKSKKRVSCPVHNGDIASSMFLRS